MGTRACWWFGSPSGWRWTDGVLREGGWLLSGTVGGDSCFDFVELPSRGNISGSWDRVRDLGLSTRPGFYAEGCRAQGLGFSDEYSLWREDRLVRWLNWASMGYNALFQ